MWPILFCLGIELISSEQVANAEVPPTKPNHTLNLFTERWDWNAASEESKTEWGIVLKRYYLVDTLFFELQRRLSDTLGLKDDISSDLSEDSLKHIQKVMTKAQTNLKIAEEDQNTSDATFASMEKHSKANKLTEQEKKSLVEEHDRERHGFSVLAGHGKSVMQNAEDFLFILKACVHQEAKVNKTSLLKSINETVPAKSDAIFNRTSLSKVKLYTNRSKSMIKDLKSVLQKYQKGAEAFHKEVVNFEAAQHKALSKLLAVHTTMRRSAPKGWSFLSTESFLSAIGRSSLELDWTI